MFSDTTREKNIKKILIITRWHPSLRDIKDWSNRFYDPEFGSYLYHEWDARKSENIVFLKDSIFPKGKEVKVLEFEGEKEQKKTEEDVEILIDFNKPVDEKGVYGFILQWFLPLEKVVLESEDFRQIDIRLYDTKTISRRYRSFVSFRRKYYH